MHADEVTSSPSSKAWINIQHKNICLPASLIWPLVQFCLSLCLMYLTAVRDRKFHLSETHRCHHPGQIGGRNQSTDRFKACKEKQNGAAWLGKWGEGHPNIKSDQWEGRSAWLRPGFSHQQVSSIHANDIVNTRLDNYTAKTQKTEPAALLSAHGMFGTCETQRDFFFCPSSFLRISLQRWAIARQITWLKTQ